MISGCLKAFKSLLNYIVLWMEYFPPTPLVCFESYVCITSLNNIPQIVATYAMQLLANDAQDRK